MAQTEQSGNIFRTKERVDSYECDIHNIITPAYFLRKMEESSCLHYDHWGYTYDYMVGKGQVYLLSGLYLKVDRLPRGGEHFVTETWESGHERALCTRNFVCMDDQSMQPFAWCRSEWIIVDFKTHKIVRPRDCVYETHFVDRDVDVQVWKKIAPGAEPEKTASYTVLYRDLDRYGHMNNSVYAELISSFAPVDFTKNEISEIALQFKKEAKLGDTIDIFARKEEENRYFIGGIKQDGQRCFDSLITIRQRREPEEAGGFCEE